MKKFIVAAIALFMGTASFSQSVDLGIKFGANFATISDAAGLSNKTGFQGGVFGGVKFSNKIGLQADLLYSQQGGKANGKNIELSYVNVPVVMKYYLFHGLNVQVGPQFGFIVDDNLDEVLGNLSEAEKTDVSGILGAGYDFPFGIRLDTRYSFGFSDIWEGSKGKNSVFSVALGYSFL